MSGGPSAGQAHPPERQDFANVAATPNIIIALEIAPEQHHRRLPIRVLESDRILSPPAAAHVLIRPGQSTQIIRKLVRGRRQHNRAPQRQRIRLSLRITTENGLRRAGRNQIASRHVCNRTLRRIGRWTLRRPRRAERLRRFTRAPALPKHKQAEENTHNQNTNAGNHQPPTHPCPPAHNIVACLAILLDHQRWRLLTMTVKDHTHSPDHYERLPLTFGYAPNSLMTSTQSWK